MRKLKDKFPFSVSMVIPVYNGESVVIDEIKKAEKILKDCVTNYEIIISDDKSIDRTYMLLKTNFCRERKIRLYSNYKNLGIALNVKRLYELARKDYILFFVADGDWEVNNIRMLLNKTRMDKADIVIGKRSKKGGYTNYRKLISILHNLMPRMLFGVDTIDAGSLKVYKRTVLKNLTIVSNSVFLDAEIIIKARKNNAKVSSVSITYQKPIISSGVAAKPSIVLASALDLLRVRLSLV